MKVCPRCLERYEDGTLSCVHHSGSNLLQLGNTQGRPLVGSVAGNRFLLLDVIGSGGMGTIYRAYQLSMSREVAVKILAQGVSDAEFMERFIREAQATAQLRSPHTVVVHDFGALDTGELFLAMELLSGRSLDAVIHRDQRLAPDRVVRIISQACKSLEEAHSREMIHRDIKPSNVMLEHEGHEDEHVKILDFGLVKVADSFSESGALTRPGEIHGTPPYMAPEMWTDRYGEVTPATDIYALGAMMFEMLTGKRPFNAKSVPGFLHKHLNEAPPSLAEYRNEPGLAGFDAIIRRCLEKDPGRRYGTARALRLDVQQAMNPEAPRVGLAETRSERDPRLQGGDTVAQGGADYASAHTITPSSHPSTPAMPLPHVVQSGPLTPSGLLTPSAMGVSLAPGASSLTAPVGTGLTAPASPTPSPVATLPATSDPAASPITSPALHPPPSRVPVYVAVGSLIIIAAALVVIAGGRPDVKDPPKEVPKELPKEVKVVHTATVAKIAVKEESKAKRVPQVTKESAGPKPPTMSEPKIIGNLDPANAKSVLGSVEREINTCYRRASSPPWLTLRVLVHPNGKPSAVRVSPESGDAKRFRECVEPAILSKSFSSFEGNFGTVTVEIEK